MEKHKLIQKRFGVSIFLVLMVFFTYQPLVHSESEEHVLKLKPKESFEIRNGRIVFREHCAPCHGDTGKGNGNYYASGLEPKPRNFTDSAFMNQVQDDYLVEVIKKGTAAFGKSPYCPPWGDTLKEDEKVRNIVSFLRTLVSAGK